MVSKETPTRVPICGSSCWQEQTSTSICYLYLILMLRIGKKRLETKEQRQALKRLIVWIQVACHLLSKLQEKTSPKLKQKLPDSVSNILLKRDGEMFD